MKIKSAMQFKLHKIIVLIMLSQVYIGIGTPLKKKLVDENSETSTFQPKVLYSKRAGMQSSPLDPGENISHALEVLQSLVGMIGQSSGGMTYGLTGISLHDCSVSFKDKDPSQISCDEFFETLQNCESLQNLKPQFKAAQKRYHKIKGRSASARRPCSSESESETPEEPESEPKSKKKSKKSRSKKSKNKNKKHTNTKHTKKTN